MSSLAILKEGVGATWRIRLAHEAMEYKQNGEIYQQAGMGMQKCVVHSCPNMGEPIDSARHRAAAAVFAAAEKMPRAPKGKAEKSAALLRLGQIWIATT